jgi:hypothetical protein
MSAAAMSTLPAKRPRRTSNDRALGLVPRPVQLVPIGWVKPAEVENYSVYHRRGHDDPGQQDLNRSVKKNGILQPLGVTLDGDLFSGQASRLASP